MRRETRPAIDTFARAYVDQADDIEKAKPGTPIPFLASSPGVKRDGINLRSNGWRLDNYRTAGGPVLWCHDHQRPPIGRADAGVERDRLRMPVVFDQEDEFARTIESKVRRRFIRACSVGWDFVTGEGKLLDHARMSYDYLNREAFYDLTELSIVPVGADPQAMVERQRRGLQQLGRQLVAMFDAQERPDGATADEVREAVTDITGRLGLDLDAPAARPGGRLVRADELPALLRSLGVEQITDSPVPAGKNPLTTAPAAVDTDAARAVLAAFPFLKGDTQ